MMRPAMIALFVSVLFANTAGIAEEKHQQRSPSFQAAGAEVVVAAGRQVTARAGMQILEQGGNAIDSAVAMLLVQTVTESKFFCFGGEVPIIIYDARRQIVEVLSGQGAAPRLATLEYFQNHKNGKIPGKGDPAGAAVPAVLHTCLTALDRSGTMTFSQVAQPMLRALDRDEPNWSRDLLRTIRKTIEAEQESPDDRRRGLQLAIDYFYRGPVARQLDQWSRKNGGLIRYADLADHKTHVELPVAIDYRGYTVYKCGFWTQGPFLLQTLRLLEGFDLKAMGHNSSEYVHVLTESMKLALADRDLFYGDPLFVQVPMKGLLSKKYADVRRPLIDLKQASIKQRPGNPLANKPLVGVTPRSYKLSAASAMDTTTCLVADKWGNVVAATPSGWGGTLAGKTGIQLGSRLISLNTWPGHPNCIEPGKRPRITLTPTMVFHDGKPVIAISVAGGDLQDQVTLQVLLNMVEFGQPPAEAVSAARFSTAHHVGSFNQPPAKLGSLSIYKSVGQRTIAELISLGHKVNQIDGPSGQPIALRIDPQTGMKQVAGDPRAGRHVMAN